MRRVLMPLLVFLQACAAPQAPPDVAVAPGQYSAAFDAARATLTRYNFQLERVDARAGVITTRSKPTAGLATPWDREQSTLAQMWEDLLDEHRRTVRITFDPATPTADLRESTAPVTLHVDATISRVQHAGRRLEPTAMQHSSVAIDPDLQARGLWPTYEVAFSQDPQLARRLADEIRQALPK
jgi:hypothetical protein